MTRVAWFQPFSGIAGDMALGALVDAGADVDEVRALIGLLPVADLPASSWALTCLLYTSPSPRDKRQSRMPSSA